MSKVFQPGAQAGPGSALEARRGSRTAARSTISLVKSALAEQPYILSTPSDKPYNLPPQHVDNWRVGRLFGADEERLQYQSFFWRDSATTLFQLEAAHEEDNRQREVALWKAGGPKNGALTPLHLQATKKKISLSDYKKAKSSGQGGTPLASASPIMAPVKQPIKDVARQPSSLNPNAGSGLVGEKLATTSDVSTVSAKQDVEVTQPVSPVREVRGTLSEPTIVVPEVQPEIKPRSAAHDLSKGGSATTVGSAAVAQGLKRSHDEAVGLKDAASAHNAHSPRPAKKSRLESPAEDSITALPKTPNSSIEDLPDFEGSGEQHEKNAGMLRGNGMTLNRDTPPGPDKKKVRDESSVSPLTPSRDNATSEVEDRGIPGWIPGASPWHISGQLPPHLSDSPSWLNAYSARPEYTHSKTPQSGASPDTLRLSATFSQTSQSSLSSSVVDVAQPISDQALSTKEPTGPVTVDSLVLSVTRTLDMDQRAANREERKDKTADHDSVETIEAPRSARKSVKSTAETNVSNAAVLDEALAGGIRLLPAAEILTGSKLVVRLKYGRSRVKNIQRILQLKPTPKRDVTHASTVTPMASLSSVEQHVGETVTGQAHSKRSREKDDERSSEPALKRKKLDQHDAKESPRTPTAPAYSPITVTPASSLHRQVLTPKRDTKGIRSIAQALNPKASTPQGTVGTPNASISTEHLGGSSQSVSERGSGNEGGIWAQEHNKQNQLAKHLRKNAQALLKSKGTNEAGIEAKNGAIEGLESILCFMVAFLALGQYMDSPKSLIRAWESLVPWGSEICRACQPFPHLHGLALLLRTAYCTVIANQHGRMNSADMSSFVGESEVLQKVLINLRRMQRSAEDGDRLLSKSTLAAEYPLANAEYQKLPLGVMTKTMGVVRLGLRFLGEWTRAEKLGWKQRLEEGICSQLQ